MDVEGKEEEGKAEGGRNPFKMAERASSLHLA